MENKLGLQQISLDVSGLKRLNEEGATIKWLDKDEVMVALSVEPGVPFSRTATIDDIRKTVAKMFTTLGTLVEVRTTTIGSGAGLLFLFKKLIVKNKMSQGLLYLQGLLVPVWPGGTFFLTTSAMERGITGVREASVMAL